MLANPGFGTLVTASGSSYTWAENSRENRLTPFANDPVGDPTAEAIYLRDDERGHAWGATPGPLRRAKAGGRFVCRHAAGVTRFEHEVDGIRQRARGVRGGERSGQVPGADAREHGRADRGG